MISLRDWTKNVNNDLEKIPAIIDKIIRDNRLEVMLVPFQSKGEEDISLMNKILDQCIEKNHISIYKGTDTLSQLSGAKLVIGMRLHSMIFGAITATPIIGINYSDKVRNFMSDIGMKEYCINSDELEKLPGIVEKAIRKSPITKADLSEKTKELRRLLYSSSLKLAL